MGLLNIHQLNAIVVVNAGTTCLVVQSKIDIDAILSGGGDTAAATGAARPDSSDCDTEGVPGTEWITH
jgi:hypothetical protein